MSEKAPQTRRDFIIGGGACAATIAAASGSPVPAAANTQAQSSDPIFGELPRTGERIPAIGLGTFETFDISPGGDRSAAFDVMEVFHQAGGRVIDTSPLYGASEAIVGDAAALHGFGEDLFLTTKAWDTGRWLGDESDYRRQFQQSQLRLWRDQIDTVLVHSLTNTPTALRFLKRMKAEGGVRHVGVTHFLYSHYDALEPLIRSGDLDFVQLNYSVLSRRAEDRLLPLAEDTGTAVMANMPFEKARVFPIVEDVELPSWASDIDCSNWPQVFLKFVISHPAVTCVIPATSQADHATENMGALRGRLPDQALREEILRFLTGLDGFATAMQTPPYPGKSYGGLAEFPLGQP